MKKTEFGVIPEDWGVSTVGDEFSIQLGKMLDSEKNEGIPKPYIGNRAVQWRRIELDDIGFIKLTPSDLLRFRLQNGDLLVCEGGEIGRAAIWREQVPECYFQKALHRLRSNRGYRADLLLCLLERWSSTGFLMNFVTQTSIAHLPKDKFETVPLPIPSKPEQEAIAEALGDADTLIESLEQLIAKKRHLKRGAMQKLLTGKKRLLCFGAASKEASKTTDVGVIPNDWFLQKLGDLVDEPRSIRYGIVQPGKYDPNGRFMVRGQDYSKGWVEPSQLFRVSAQVEERYKNARLKTGDVIITIVGAGTGYVEAIPDWLEGANLTQTTARIAIDPNKADSTFLKYVLQSPVGSRQVTNFMKGGAQPGLNCGDVEKFLVPTPPTLNEQTAIAAILSDMDAEIAALETKLGKYRQLKQGMMYNLLTGRIRLI